MAQMLAAERDGRVWTVLIDNPPHNFMTAAMVAELDRLDGAATATLGRIGDRSPASRRSSSSPTTTSPRSSPASSPSGSPRLRPRGLAGALAGGRSAASRAPRLASEPRCAACSSCADPRRLPRMNEPDGQGLHRRDQRARHRRWLRASLACDVRYIADAQTSIGLPEMTMGFNPAGGTQRSPGCWAPAGAGDDARGTDAEPERGARGGHLIHRWWHPRACSRQAIETARGLRAARPDPVRGLKAAVYEGGSATLARAWPWSGQMFWPRRVSRGRCAR